MIYVLIGCSATKRDETLPAADLYCGQLFLAAKKYAEQRGHRYFILSACYGLLHPSFSIQSYDMRMHTKRKSEKEQWGWRVAQRLQQEGVKSGDTVICLAGREYCDWFEHHLAAAGIGVERPLKGKGIGLQKQWLAKKIKAWDEVKAEQNLQIAEVA